MGTINIRLASLQLVSATNATASADGTAISNLVSIESIPGTEAGLRDVTELADTTQANRISKLKRLVGELAYVVHVPATAVHTDRTGTEGILRLDIPTSAGTNTSETTYVQVMMQVGFTSDQPEPGDDESDVRRRIAAAPLAAATMATASY